jgi:pilus assembly protein Flp/PilA
MCNWVRKLWRDEEGATMVEYGIMVALIAAVCITVVATLGTQIQTVFTNITDKIAPAA